MLGKVMFLTLVTVDNAVTRVYARMSGRYRPKDGAWFARTFYAWDSLLEFSGERLWPAYDGERWRDLF